MLLLVVIVQSADAHKLSARLVEQGLRVTQINSAGGFLGAENVVLLLGVDDARRDDVGAIIRETCQVRQWYINAMPSPGAIGLPSTPMMAPIEVEVGGGVVFGVPIKRFLRLQGGDAAPAFDETFEVTGAATAQRTEANTMNLVVAIIQNEDADAVAKALVAAGHRLTRVNSAGGFFRRGNATLLIGVEAGAVNDVVQIIQTNCRPRTAPNPPQDGLPMYGATVFVLDASHFERI